MTYVSSRQQLPLECSYFIYLYKVGVFHLYGLSAWFLVFSNTMKLALIVMNGVAGGASTNTGHVLGSPAIAGAHATASDPAGLYVSFSVFDGVSVCLSFSTPQS